MVTAASPRNAPARQGRKARRRKTRGAGGGARPFPRQRGRGAAVKRGGGRKARRGRVARSHGGAERGRGRAGPGGDRDGPGGTRRRPQGRGRPLRAAQGRVGPQEPQPGQVRGGAGQAEGGSAGPELPPHLRLGHDQAAADPGPGYFGDWGPVEHPQEGHSLLRALHGPAQVLLLRLQGGAARVGVAAPAAGAEPAVPAVPEPRGRVPHGAGAAPGARHPGKPLHPAPRVPGAVPDGGQLQQSVPGQGQHPSRELHLLHRHPAGHHPGRDRGLHRGRLRADPVPRGGADPLLQLAPQDDRLRQEAGLGAGSLQLLQFWGAAAESRGPPDPLDGAGHAGDRVRPAAGDDRLKHNKFLLFLFIPIFSAFFLCFSCLFLSFFPCFLAVSNV